MTVGTHWHVRTTSDDDNEFAGTSIYWALDAIQEELAILADFEYQGISANGDSGDFEGAYRAFQANETYQNVMNNIANVLKQHSLSPISPQRAPLYQPDWEHPTPRCVKGCALEVSEYGGWMHANDSDDSDHDPSLASAVGKQTGLDAMDAANARLYETAVGVAHMVNTDTPLLIWRCPLNDVINVTDANTGINGELTQDGIPLYDTP